MNFKKLGLAICLVLLFGSLAVMFWPFIRSTEFWITTGFVVGLVGSMIFAIANTQNTDKDEG